MDMPEELRRRNEKLNAEVAVLKKRAKAAYKQLEIKERFEKAYQSLKESAENADRSTAASDRIEQFANAIDKTAKELEQLGHKPRLCQLRDDHYAAILNADLEDCNTGYDGSIDLVADMQRVCHLLLLAIDNPKKVEPELKNIGFERSRVRAVEEVFFDILSDNLDEIKPVPRDKRLRSRQQIQAVHQRQRDRESEQQERHKLYVESWNQWKAIGLSFDGWAKRNILGDELPGYQSDSEFAANIEKLLAATKAHHGPDSIAKVADFNAEVYRTGDEDQERHFHAAAVEWIIELLNDADEPEGALAAVLKSKESLKGYGEFELESFGTRLQQAAKVIRMGVVHRFCERCGQRLSVNCFDVAECCSDPITPIEAFVKKYGNYTLKRLHFNNPDAALSWRDETVSACRDAEKLGFEAPITPDHELSENEAMRIIEGLVRKVEKAIKSETDGTSKEQPAETTTQVAAAQNDEASTATDPNPLASCKPSERKAYFSFKLAEAKLERRLEDRDAWDALHENDWSDCYEGELEGYKAPQYGTWSRQLRVARKATGEQKYTPRTKR